MASMRTPTGVGDLTATSNALRTMATMTTDTGAPHRAATRPPKLARYAYESDMVGAIARAGDALTRRLPDSQTYEVFFEVQAHESVPDLVFAQFNPRASTRRDARDVPALLDHAGVAVLTAARLGTVDIAGLAHRCGVSEAHLRRRVLPALADAGWLARVPRAGAHIDIATPFEPVLNWAVTVEAKKAKWREALSQAHRHLVSADHAFIALDQAHTRPVLPWVEAMADEGVGFVSVDAGTDTATVERVAPRGQRRPHPVAHTLLGERLWQMRRDGHTTGPVAHVFGQVLGQAAGGRGLPPPGAVAHPCAHEP